MAGGGIKLFFPSSKENEFCHDVCKGSTVLAWCKIQHSLTSTGCCLCFFACCSQGLHLHWLHCTLAHQMSWRKKRAVMTCFSVPSKSTSIHLRFTSELSIAFLDSMNSDMPFDMTGICWISWRRKKNSCELTLVMWSSVPSNSTDVHLCFSPSNLALPSRFNQICNLFILATSCFWLCHHEASNEGVFLFAAKLMRWHAPVF